MDHCVCNGTTLVDAGALTNFWYMLQPREEIYGLLEAQFRRTFAEAERMKGNTGENLLMLLERRLDNVVYHLGFGLSRSHARQIVRHGHVALNGKRCSIPSALVRAGDVVGPNNRPNSMKAVNPYSGW